MIGPEAQPVIRQLDLTAGKPGKTVMAQAMTRISARR